MTTATQKPEQKEQDWLVSFSAGARGRPRNAETIVTTHSANKARRLGIDELTTKGQSWVSSASANVRPASPQDLKRLRNMTADRAA